MTWWLILGLWGTAGAAVAPAEPAQKAEQEERAEPAPLIEEALPGSDGCRVRLEFGYLPAQDVLIKGDRVTGPDFNLTREADVTWGFIRGMTSRLRVSGDRLTGSIGEMDLMLQVDQPGPFTRLAGMVGARHVTVKMTDHRVQVSAAASSQIGDHATLVLTRSRGQRLSGQLVMGSELGSASLVTFGCELATIRARPDLIVTLFMWWLGV